MKDKEREAGARHTPMAWRCLLPIVLGAVTGASVAAAAPTKPAVQGATLGTAAERFQARAARRAGLAALRAQHNSEGIHDGVNDQIEVTPMFDLLEKRPGKASGVFHVDVDNLRDADVRVAYAWHIADDLGNLLAEGRGPNVGRLPGRGLFVSDSWQLPGLKDGFYRVVVTVVTAASRPEDGTAQVVDWWLEVVNGELQEIDESEWYARSRAELATEDK
jgi:hypothetical protein